MSNEPSSSEQNVEHISEDIDLDITIKTSAWITLAVLAVSLAIPTTLTVVGVLKLLEILF